jgi:hypothetical protein
VFAVLFGPARHYVASTAPTAALYRTRAAIRTDYVSTSIGVFTAAATRV